MYHALLHYNPDSSPMIRPACAAHSFVPICTNREHALANAKTSSSPEKMDVCPICWSESPRSSMTLRTWSDAWSDLASGSSENTWKMGTSELANSFVRLS